MDTTPEFKLLVCGDPGTGKRSWLQLFEDAQRGMTLPDNYDQDDALRENGVCIYPVNMQFNIGSVKFNCWTPSNNKNDQDQNDDVSLPDSFYLNGQAAVIFFDVTSRMSYKNLPNHFRNIIRVCDFIPVVLIGNKNDCHDDESDEPRTVRPKMICFHRKKNLHYVDMSVKAQYNVLKPFEHLFRRLVGDPEAQLVHPPSMVTPEVEQNEEAYKNLERQLDEANNVGFPDEDEDF